MEDVLFEHVVVNGKPLAAAADHIFEANEHVKGITVRAESASGGKDALDRRETGGAEQMK